MRVIRKIGPLFTIGILIAVSAAAQYWPKPADRPGIDVTCTGCLEFRNGKLTPGYPATIQTFTGRFLDSQATQDYQQPFKTARAESVMVVPATHRIYMQIGSAVFAYSGDTFFDRVKTEQMMSVNQIPTQSAFPPHPSPVDLVLAYDSYFYAESTPSNGWQVGTSDGQRRLFAFDVDDQNYVYLAYSLFGWGIVKDNLGTGHDLMQSIHQDLTADLTPRAIAVVKTSDGRYFVLVNGGENLTNIYDVTDRSNPLKRSILRKIVTASAKSTNLDRIAFVGDGSVQIYASDAIINGGAPLISPYTGGGQVNAVTPDGTNFYATVDTPTGLQISKFTPSGGSYTRTDYPVNAAGGSSTIHLSWGDGYLVWAGSINGAAGLRVFKLQGGAPVEIDFGNYFQKYYIQYNDARYTHPNFAYFFSSTVVKKGTHTYLIATGYSLGDVYELPSADSVVANGAGTGGTVNSKVPPDAPAGPFYGDPVKFRATTGATSPMSITWDFGNPEASPSADPNTATGQTGVEVAHRYNGLTSASALPITRTVKVTNAVDANISATTSVTLQKPTVRFGVGNYKFLFAQPNASSSAPIVVGDSFFDASDGTVESHYNTWSIDGGAATRTAPPGAASVGTCGTHTLNFDAHYGPYAGSPPASLGADMPIGIHGAGFDFVYSVRPFAAAIDIVSDAQTVSFKSLARATGDQTALSANQLANLNYRWELLDANNAVVFAGPTGTGLPVSPQNDFNVSKQTFSGRRNLRAHLVINSPGGAGGACAAMSSSEAYTIPLSAPDPNIVGGCNQGLSGGPSCTYSVNSSGDQTGWTYAWSAVGATPAQGSGSTYSPSFQNTGTFTINLTATNSVGSTTAPAFSQAITVAAPTCPTMIPTGSNLNVFIAYHNASFSCSASPGSGPCGVGETVTFNASTFNGYNFDCGPHTFVWNFGDGATGSGIAATHAYTSAGAFTAQLTISNNTQQGVVVTQVVNVGGSVTPPPPSNPPPSNPPPSGGCGTMRANDNVFISYHDNGFTCTALGGNCPANSPISFAASAFGDYNFGCGNHSFLWNFGDGQAGSSVQTPSHSFASGTYTVTCAISGPTGSVNLSSVVHVGNGTNPPPSNPPPSNPPPSNPPPSGACSPVIPNVTFFVDFVGPQSGCTEYSGDCSSSETLPFALKTFNYDFGCTTHSIQWDFGDNTTPTAGFTANHRYVAAGAYNLQITINANGTGYLVKQSIKVVGGNPSQPPPGSSYAFDFTSQPWLGVPNGYVFTAFPVGSTSAANVTYTWTFGDGETTTTNSPTTRHVYNDGKTYSVVLSVSGYTGSVQHAIVTRRRPSHP